MNKYQASQPFLKTVLLTTCYLKIVAQSWIYNMVRGQKWLVGGSFIAFPFLHPLKRVDILNIRKQYEQKKSFICKKSLFSNYIKKVILSELLYLQL